MSDGRSEAAEATALAKVTLRTTILARRNAMDGATRARHSSTITAKLLALRAYRAADVVAAYAAFGSEFDTSEFLAAVMAAGKQLVLPRINRALRVLELRQVIDLSGDLVAGVWGIREPATRCMIVDPKKVDFMLVPGVAFSPSGARLGYGGGFYDRLLASLDSRTVRIAAAFQLQLVAQLPEAPHDQRVSAVVMEH
jgi:5-formyltetrahydrofolate cyclo-ligase